MTPNLPKAALAVFGPEPTPDGAWGGVPWKDGVAHPITLEGLRGGSVTTFAYAPGSALLAVTDSDNDLDGLGGSKDIDPDYEEGTALLDAHGRSCDSFEFPGVVISPALEKFGVRLGDFCLVSWNGAIRSAQVYDIGPTRKAGENSLYLNRGLGIVPASKSAKWAARNGHDVQDVCTLIFARSGPGHALPVDEIIAGAHACWKQFTGRAAAGAKGAPAVAPVPAAASETAPVTGPGGTEAGSVGLAVPLALAGITSGFLAVAPLVAEAAPTMQEIGQFFQMIFWLAGFVGALLGAAVAVKQLRHKPLQSYATKGELTEIDERSKGRAAENLGKIDKLERLLNDKHAENIRRANEIAAKLDRNFEAVQEKRETLLTDVRHEVRNELSPLRNELTLSNQDTDKQFRAIASDIGSLTASVRSNEALAAEVRQQMGIVLGRLPRGGATT